MLLWYVWVHLVDGTWHKLDDIAKQLRIPDHAVSWAANFLGDTGLAEVGRDGSVRLQQAPQRLEDAIKTLAKA